MEAICPKHVAVPGPDRGVGISYRSPFDRWEETAAVRQAPRRELGEEFSSETSFPDHLTPLLRDPGVRALGPDAVGYVKTQQLYRFLDFTSKLEHLVVNRTVLGAAYGQLGLDLPEPMRFDAHKIYVDEAYHGLFSADMLRQAVGRTGIAPDLPQAPAFLRALGRARDENAQHEGLVEILFVIVSETLITGALAKVGHGASVDGEVAGLMRDHARDEGRHHTYFRMLARYLWAQCTPADRRVIADVLPALIEGFTAPEVDAAERDLLAIGMCKDQAAAVVADVFAAPVVRGNAIGSARATIQCFVDLGIADYAGEQLERLFADMANNNGTE